MLFKLKNLFDLLSISETTCQKSDITYLKNVVTYYDYGIIYIYIYIIIYMHIYIMLYIFIYIYTYIAFHYTVAVYQNV